MPLPPVSIVGEPDLMGLLPVCISAKLLSASSKANTESIECIHGCDSLEPLWCPDPIVNGDWKSLGNICSTPPATRTYGQNRLLNRSSGRYLQSMMYWIL